MLISYKIYRQNELGMVANACKPTTWEAEAEGLQQVQGQPELHGQFQESLSYLLYSKTLS